MGLFGRRKPSLPRVIDDPARGDAPAATVRDDALRDGNWRPAAQLLATTADPAYRQHRIETLAEACVEDSRWIDDWLRTEPESVDAKIVWACSGVNRAWAERGAARADATGKDAFERFFTVLDENEADIKQALRLSPKEPALWATTLWHGLGSQIKKEQFAGRWQALKDIDPYNRNAHNAALQYYCDKWYGSHDEMYAFAREAASNAPAGSGIAICVLQAHIEYYLQERDEGASMEQLNAFYRSRTVNDDIDAALAKWEGSTPPSGPSLLHDRSVVAMSLCLAGRWQEAAQQFEASDNTIIEYPWYYLSDDHARRLQTLAIENA